jgi:hypothetical protein
MQTYLRGAEMQFMKIRRKGLLSLVPPSTPKLPYGTGAAVT